MQKTTIKKKRPGTAQLKINNSTMLYKDTLLIFFYQNIFNLVNPR